jgi:hypothetical protein
MASVSDAARRRWVENVAIDIIVVEMDEDREREQRAK